MSFYLIVIIAYACALSTLTAPGDPATISGFKALIYCFWKLIQVTVGCGDMTSELDCTSIDNVPYDLQWFFNILMTFFYIIVSIMMLNLLIGMIGNTYNQYAESSKSLLLLEKYNITCSLERYLSEEGLNRERKKFAIELNEDTDDNEVSNNNCWAFEHVFFDKNWKNKVDEEANDETGLNKAGLKEKIVLLIICPQKDFHEGGSLAVPGADADSKRIAEMIMDEQNIHRIDEIYVALDSHYRTHIAHAICWKHVETTCPFEKDGCITWNYPYDKDEPMKYAPCFTALGNLPYFEGIYDSHSSYISKRYMWKEYCYEIHTNRKQITLNFFLEDASGKDMEPVVKSGKIVDQHDEHRKEKYQYLPFKKVITFKSESITDLRKKSDFELHKTKAENSDIVNIEYWYHPKEFAEILNSDINSKIISETKKRPLFEVIKNDGFDLEWADYYTKSLERKGNYKLVIWPEHCIIGSSGHSVVDSLNNALQHWAIKNNKAIQYIEKGQNCKSELYSILEAEVEDPADVSTAFDADLFAQLKIADRILICGQASSHCVKFTVEDLERYWPGEDRDKMIVLEDGCSPVGSYEASAKEFFVKIQEKGVIVTKCADAFSIINAESKTEQQMVDDAQDHKIKLQAERDKNQDLVMDDIKQLLKKLHNTHHNELIK